MGWMYCGQDDLGRDIGYGVDAICDFEGCEAKIDRGLGYICGDMHCDTEKGCALYFCSDHRYKHDCPDRDEYEVAQETDLGELVAWARIRCLLCVDGTPRPEKGPTGWAHSDEEASKTSPCTAGFVWDRIVELEEQTTYKGAPVQSVKLDENGNLLIVPTPPADKITLDMTIHPDGTVETEDDA